jgi:hypothetical protein
MIIRSVMLSFFVVAISACSANGDLTVTNSSDFTITEMHVTQTTNISWGPNLLAGDVLLPGEHTTVTASCDTYDVMLVDSTNVTCEIDNIDLCLNSANFVITNSSCAAFRQTPAAQMPAAPTATAR